MTEYRPSPFFPANGVYYDEVEVELVSELLDRGYPQKQITERLIEQYRPTWTVPYRINDKRRSIGRRVQVIAKDRWNWCAQQNPVTIEMAFLGHRGAWLELNFYERRTLILRLQHMIAHDIRHPLWEEDPFEYGGLIRWAEAVGLEDTQTITNTFGRRKNRQRATAAA